MRNLRRTTVLLCVVVLLVMVAPVPVQADITSNLIVWWPFDTAVGSEGTVTDMSGNANHGTMGTTPNVATFTTACKVNGCFTFDGAGDNLFHSTVALSTTTLSLSAWVRPTGTPLNDPTESFHLAGAIFDLNQFLGISRGTIAGANDAFYFYHWDGDEDRIAVPYTNNVWSHLVWVHTGGTLLAYKDGALVTSIASGTTGAGGATGVVVGQAGGGTFYWQGEIDEVRVYTRGLSATDVAELYVYGQAMMKRRLLLMSVPPALRFVQFLQGRGRW